MAKNVKRVTVIGAGYVGLSLSVALAKHYQVTILEIDQKKIESINNKESFLLDPQISSELLRRDLILKATSNRSMAVKNADLIFCCLPTNFDIKINSFNTKIIEEFATYIKNANQG